MTIVKFKDKIIDNNVVCALYIVYLFYILNYNNEF